MEVPFLKNYQKRILIIFSMLVLLFSTVIVSSAQEEVLDNDIPEDIYPESWFEDTRTASEMDINDFSQSPFLDDRVDEGEIPEVEERLPDDPMVVEPYEEIGEYGGTAVTFTNDEADRQESGVLNSPEGWVQPDPMASEVKTSYAKDWYYNEEGTELTLEFREGMKWSDGEPVTAHDVKWWYDNAGTNTDINTVPVDEYEPIALTDVVVEDDYTVTFEFNEPDPLRIYDFGHHPVLGEIEDGTWIVPSHHMEDYHIDHLDEDELEEKLDEHDFDDWTQLWELGLNPYDPEVDRPTLSAYKIVERSPELLEWERNPYYPKVDPEGQQLPYIDEIQLHVVQDIEMMNSRAVTGDATIAGVQTEVLDIPMYKENEDSGGYETYLYNRVQSSDVGIFSNLTHEDERYREIFQDDRWRKALSLAIDRTEINNSIYMGQATEMQATVLPTSRYYEEEYAEAYIDYDPERAEEMLDEMGVKDYDDDGEREGPDEEDLNITLEWTPMETPKQEIMELVTSHWRDIGIDIELDQLDGGLLQERVSANETDMTLWHIDRSTDILFPREPMWYVPYDTPWWENNLWREWENWYITGGEDGEEPPENIKELQGHYETMIHTMDEDDRVEAGKAILESQAENLWTIGTVGMAPQPLLVDEDLKNVPERGLWGWDNRWSMPYHPETWYLEQ